jgi:hypothetical protein
LNTVVNQSTVAEESQEVRPETRLERFGSAMASASSLRPDRPLLRRGLFLTLGALVAGSVAIAVAGEWSSLAKLDLRFDPIWVVVAVVAFLVLQLVHSELWRRILDSLGQRLEPRRARAIWCTSILARYVPSSMLMPMVRVAMAEPEGVPRRVCLASSIYEVALTFTGALALGAYFVIELPELDGHPARFLVALVPLIAILALHPRVFQRLANVGLRRLGRDPLPGVLPASALLGYLVLYAGSFAIGGFGIYALAMALHPVSPSDLPTMLSAHAVGYAISVLAFMIPGGLGAREAGIASALTGAVPGFVALAVAVTTRVVQLAIELVLAAITPALARRRSRRARRRRVVMAR